MRLCLKSKKRLPSHCASLSAIDTGAPRSWSQPSPLTWLDAGDIAHRLLATDHRGRFLVQTSVPADWKRCIVSRAECQHISCSGCLDEQNHWGPLEKGEVASLQEQGRSFCGVKGIGRSQQGAASWCHVFYTWHTYMTHMYICMHVLILPLQKTRLCDFIVC